MTYEAYRNAGELLGRLRATMGFGDASLDVIDLATVQLSFRFDARGKPRVFAVRLSLAELDSMPASSMESMANKFADRIRRESQWVEPGEYKQVEELAAQGGMFYSMNGQGWCDLATESWVLVPGKGYMKAEK